MPEIEAAKAAHQKQKAMALAGYTKPMRVVYHNDVPYGAELVIDQNQWYRSFAKGLLFAVLGLAISTIFLSSALTYAVFRPAVTLSYLVDQDGNSVQLDERRNPVTNTTDLLLWTAKKVKQLHNLAFSDYIDHVLSMRSDFTPKAFERYQYALLNSQTIAKLKAGRLVMWSEPLSAPRLIKSVPEDNPDEWHIEMKIRVFIGGGKSPTIPTDLTAKIRIQKTSRANNLAGYVISKYLEN